MHDMHAMLCTVMFFNRNVTRNGMPGYAILWCACMYPSFCHHVNLLFVPAESGVSSPPPPPHHHHHRNHNHNH